MDMDWGIETMEIHHAFIEDFLEEYYTLVRMSSSEYYWNPVHAYCSKAPVQYVGPSLYVLTFYIQVVKFLKKISVIPQFSVPV